MFVQRLRLPRTLHTVIHRSAYRVCPWLLLDVKIFVYDFAVRTCADAIFQ